MSPPLSLIFDPNIPVLLSRTFKPGICSCYTLLPSPTLPQSHLYVHLTTKNNPGVRLRLSDRLDIAHLRGKTWFLPTLDSGVVDYQSVRLLTNYHNRNN